MSKNSDTIDRFFRDAREELERAREHYTAFTSAHEGESVLREEFEELVKWVHEKPAKRDPDAMRRECVQIAAMAARFAVELCDTGGVNGR